jgi:putative transposase
LGLITSDLSLPSKGTRPEPKAGTGTPAVDVKTLHAKIGELTLVNGFFGKRARQSRSVAERKAMIDCSHALPLKIYPYLLRKLSVTRPNQVWAMDITSIPMARGFVYLAAVVDGFSRRVLAWRLSITLEAAFCIEAVEEALARYGRPGIFNTDQGSQFTSHDFTSVLLNSEISLDGKGAWRDTVFVERLWRSIKYEEVYLKAYDSVSEARASIGRSLTFYNGQRPHSSLDRKTPDQAPFNPLPQLAAA